jgi:hypothetical protein
MMDGQVVDGLVADANVVDKEQVDEQVEAEEQVEDQVEAEEQVETDAELLACIISIGAPPKFQIDPKDVAEERLYTLYAYVAINQQTYGVPENVNLSFSNASNALSTRLVLDSREKSFKAELLVRGAIQRDMSAKYNPQGRKHFIFEIAISAPYIDDIELEPPGSFDVLEYFHKPQDWDPTKKGRLTFSTKTIRVLNAAVPKLLDDTAEAKLQHLFAHILDCRSRGEVFHFDIIVSYLPFDGDQDTLLNHFVSRVISDDHIDNPAWV